MTPAELLNLAIQILPAVHILKEISGTALEAAGQETQQIWVCPELPRKAHTPSYYQCYRNQVHFPAGIKEPSCNGRCLRKETTMLHSVQWIGKRGGKQKGRVITKIGSELKIPVGHLWLRLSLENSTWIQRVQHGDTNQNSWISRWVWKINDQYMMWPCAKCHLMVTHDLKVIKWSDLPD